VLALPSVASFAAPLDLKTKAVDDTPVHCAHHGCGAHALRRRPTRIRPLTPLGGGTRWRVGSWTGGRRMVDGGAAATLTFAESTDAAGLPRSYDCTLMLSP